MESELIFLGYSAQERRAGEWAERLGVERIANVGQSRHKDWLEACNWNFNSALCWNSEAEGWSAVSEADRGGYEMFAYWILPCFLRGDEPVDPRGLAKIFPDTFPHFPPPSPVPLSPAYRVLGCDIVGIGLVGTSGVLPYGTSPLSDNLMATETKVNRLCLIDSLDDAIAFARRCNVEHPEPELFYILRLARLELPHD